MQQLKSIWSAVTLGWPVLVSTALIGVFAGTIVALLGGPAEECVAVGVLAAGLTALSELAEPWMERLFDALTED